MSNLMWNDKRIKIDWRDIAIHNEKNIKGFFDSYRFLSNFHKCKIIFDGIEYNSSEGAYMAQKTLDLELRQQIAALPAFEAKKLGRKIKLRDGWDDMKYNVMYDVLWAKFTQNPDLKEKLLETGDKYLEETLWWKDTYWGVDHKLGGQNNLGKILMDIREKLK